MDNSSQIGNKIIWADKVSSTNHMMLEMIETQHLPDGSVIVAGYQTAGRGLDKNTWESEAGKNLTFTVLLYPDFLPAEEQYYLTKAISLGLIDFLKDEIQEEVFIKWPNDLYIGRKKVAGILIQNGIKANKFDYAIVGIGLNVNQDIFYSDAPNPVSLRNVTGKDYDLAQILRGLCKRMNIRYEQLRWGAKKSLDDDYLSNLLRYCKPASYIYKGKPLDATIIGVNKHGQLILEVRDKNIIECDLKEVEYVF